MRANQKAERLPGLASPSSFPSRSFDSLRGLRLTQCGDLVSCHRRTSGSEPSEPFPYMAALGGFPSSAFLTLRALRNHHPKPVNRSPPRQRRYHPATGGSPVRLSPRPGPEGLGANTHEGRAGQLRRWASPVCGRKLASPVDPSTTSTLAARSEPCGSCRTTTRERAPSPAGTIDTVTYGPPKRSAFSVTQTTDSMMSTSATPTDHRIPSTAPPPEGGLATVVSRVDCGAASTSEEGPSATNSPADAGCGRGGRGASSVHSRRREAFASTDIVGQPQAARGCDRPKPTAPSCNGTTLLSVSIVRASGSELPSTRHAAIRDRAAPDLDVEPTNDRRPSSRPGASASRHRRASSTGNLPKRATARSTHHTTREGEGSTPKRQPPDHVPRDEVGGDTDSQRAVRQKRPGFATGWALGCDQSDIFTLAAATTRRPEGWCVIRPPGCLSRSTDAPGVEREARPAEGVAGEERLGVGRRRLAASAPTRPLPRRSRSDETSRRPSSGGHPRGTTPKGPSKNPDRRAESGAEALDQTRSSRPAPTLRDRRRRLRRSSRPRRVRRRPPLASQRRHMNGDRSG